MNMYICKNNYALSLKQNPWVLLLWTLRSGSSSRLFYVVPRKNPILGLIHGLSNVQVTTDLALVGFWPSFRVECRFGVEDITRERIVDISRLAGL